MKPTIHALLAGVLCAGVLLVGCKSDQTTTNQGEAAISGFVKDSNTRIGLGGATITMSSTTQTYSVTSNPDGSFPSQSFSTDSTMIVSVMVTKSGYNDTTFSIVVQSGSVAQLTILMSPKSVIVVPGGGSGIAQTIAFLGSSPQELRVYGVGGQETSILSWEVRDSLGLPIDLTHSVTMTFTLVAGPNGGEYVSPNPVSTNTVGRAYTTFNAGTKAGVVQVLAQATGGGLTRTIASQPVRLIIDGGFPVQSHFTVAAVSYNFAALNWLNRRDAITVLVGDIYSNPVAPNTAVYFHTSPYGAGESGGAGVIQPAVFTDKDGLGSVDLISGYPRPSGVYAAAGPSPGDGYHYVVARTIGQGGAVVMDSVMLLWSGVPFISNLNPTTFNIANGGSQNISFSVSDQNGHPLAAGTTITVTGQVPPPPDPNTPVNQIQVGFGLNGSVTLPDVIASGVGTTDFSFKLSDGSSQILDNVGTPVLMTISVSGPNGQALAFINGVVH